MFSSGPHQSTQSLLPELPEDLARLAARLETTVVDVREPLQESLGALLGPGTNALTPDFLELCTQALQRITFDGTAIAVPTRDQQIAAGANLPVTTLNLHVYDADPSKRFILLNGERLRESDASRDGLKVLSITPEGVVLSYGSSSFAVSIEGR